MSVLQMKYLSELQGHARAIARNLAADGRLSEERQIVCLVEEAGEVLKEWRRYAGWARSPGTKANVAEETADTVIAAFVFAHVMHVDLVEIINQKLEAIYDRGGF